MMEYIKNKLKSPVTILIVAGVVMFLAWRAPEVLDFIFGGAILVGAKAVFGIALMLFGVLISRKARAAFYDGEANGSTPYVVPAVYLASAIVVAASFISG